MKILFRTLLIFVSATYIHTVNAQVAECHALATSPSDLNKKTMGVPFAKINAPQAIAACKIAVRQISNDGQLWFQYGRALEKGKLIPDAIIAYQTGIGLNSGGAMNNMGELYLDGKGVQKDITAAESLFKRSADLGFSEAKENLAKLNSLENVEIKLERNSSVLKRTDVVQNTLSEQAIKQDRLPPCPENQFPKTCFGTYSDSGFTYIGEWQDGERSGQGTFFWPDGSKYVGKWNKHVGVSGTMTYPNGSTTQGTVENITFTEDRTALISNKQSTQLETKNNSLNKTQADVVNVSNIAKVLAQGSSPSYLLENLNIPSELNFIYEIFPLIPTFENAVDDRTRDGAKKAEDLVAAQAIVLNKFSKIQKWECEVLNKTDLFDGHVNCAVVFKDFPISRYPKIEFQLDHPQLKEKLYVKDRISFSGTIYIGNPHGGRFGYCKYIDCDPHAVGPRTDSRIYINKATIVVSNVKNIQLIK